MKIALWVIPILTNFSKMTKWPYYSNKYFRLSITWSLICHILLIFFISNKSSLPSPKAGTLTISVQSVYVSNGINKIEISSEFQDFSDEISTDANSDFNNNSGILDMPFSFASMPVTIENDYDKPAVLLSKNDLTDLELFSEKIDASKPLITIKLWIDKTGLVTKTEVLDTQLDELNTKKMAAQLGSQQFYPALKDGKGIASTKIYEIGSASAPPLH